MMTRMTPLSRRVQRGLTLVQLMVGLAIGLFIAAAGASLPHRAYVCA
mgnify:CR=1 FL=1